LFKSRKELEKEYSFKKPRAFKKRSTSKLDEVISKITGKGPFKKGKKAGGMAKKMNMGGVMKNRGGTFKGNF